MNLFMMAKIQGLNAFSAEVRPEHQGFRLSGGFLMVAYCCTPPMRTTEQHPARNITGPLGPSVAQKLSGEAFARLHKELHGVLPPVCPGYDHERMALEKGPEADRRNPQVDILPGLNLHRL